MGAAWNQLPGVLPAGEEDPAAVVELTATPQGFYPLMGIVPTKSFTTGNYCVPFAEEWIVCVCRSVHDADER